MTSEPLDALHVTGSVEAMLTHRDGFGLASATPVQRAICRVLDGRGLGELRENLDVRRALALGGASVPRAVPRELVVLAGVRTGKSLIAAASAIVASQVCDVSHLGPGEVPRIPVVSTSRDNAAVVHGHIVGRILASPVLRRLLVEEPTGERVMLRHPTGRVVELAIVAGARAGATLVARWLAGAVFDEAPRMVGADDGVVNLDDARTSILGRMLPGSSILYIGSPWAPMGPIYDMTVESHGKPSRERVVFRATGPSMNPAWWSPERIAELRAMPGGDRSYRVDVLAEFVEAEAALYSLASVDAATRASPAELPPDERANYVAAMDPATRGNAWTLALVTRDGARRRVALVREWVGSTVAPLVPSAVLAEIAAVLRPYRVDVLHTDQWAADALREHASAVGLVLRDHTIGAADRVEMYTSLGARLDEGVVELAPDAQARADLLSVRRVATPSGVAIRLPKSSNGRHADHAASLAMALSRYCDEMVAPPLPDADGEVAAMRAAAWRQVDERERGGWRDAAGFGESDWG